MRKRVVAICAAAALCVGAAALTGCAKGTISGGLEGVHVITFDANGGLFSEGVTQMESATFNNELVALPDTNPTRDGFVFNGYNVMADGSAETVTVGMSFAAATTVYAQWSIGTPDNPDNPDVPDNPDNPDVPDNPDNPDVPDNPDNPDVPDNPDNPDVPDSYTNALVVSTIQTALVDNTANIDTAVNPTQDREYMATGIALSRNAAISIKIDNATIEFFVDGASVGIDVTVTDTALAEVSTTQAGTFSFYIKHYVDGAWVVYATDGSGGGGGDEAFTPDPDSFYLLGTVNDWKASDSFKFTDNTANVEPGGTVVAEYMFTTDLSKDDRVKIWKGDDSWAYNHYEENWDYATVDTVTGDLCILSDGSFTFYLKLYDDAGDSVWVNYVSHTPDNPDVPDVPDVPTGTSAIVVSGTETVLTDNTANIDATLNPTQDKEYMLKGVALESGASVSIKIDGATIEFFVDGASRGIDVSVTNAKLSALSTTAAGTFDFYVKHYNDGAWVVYATDGTVPYAIDSSSYYLVGENLGWSPTSDDVLFVDDTANIEDTAKTQYKLVVNLKKGDRVKIWKGSDNWNYNNYEGNWDYATVDTTTGDLCILSDGTFTFYLKLYQDDGSSVWVGWVALEA